MNIGDLRLDQARKDGIVLAGVAAGRSFMSIDREQGWTPGCSWARYPRALARQGLRASGPPRATAPVDPLVVAWAAGFFDGEGCIYGYEDGSQRYRAFRFGCLVAQTVRAPLDELQHHWGGSVRYKPQANPAHADQWAWQISGQDAARFLSDILPHLRVKQEEAKVALPVMFRTHDHGVRFTEAEVEARREAITRLRHGKRKGRRAVS